MSYEDDSQLLRLWTEGRDEAAFRRIVERYAGLVHGAALRRAGDAGLAAEAAQDTFIRLARNAASLRRAEALPAWLHATAVRAAADRVRSESRHRERMKRYHLTESFLSSTPGPDNAAWREALPLLDDAIARLSETDRGLVLARYCQGESVAAAAQRYGLSPAAAQKRGERALEKLASLLRRRGVVLSAAALASGMAPRLAHAAPGGVAAKWTAAALAAPPASSAGLAGAWVAFMNVKTVSIVAALAAFCVPVGLQLHARNAPSTRTASPPGSAATAKQTSPARSEAAPATDARYVVGGVDLSALAQEIRSFPPLAGRLQRELELRAAMQSLTGVQCAAVADWLTAAPGKVELLWVTEDLFRHWTMLDREAAFAAAESIIKRFPQTSARTAVQTQWAHMDPQGMIEYFAPHLKGPRDGVPGAPGADTACWAAVRALAEQDPKAAIEAAQKIEPDEGQNVMRYALEGWSDAESPEAVLEWLGQVDDADPRKKRWYRLYTHYLDQAHPDKVWTSLLAWPDRKEATDLADSTLTFWAYHDPAAAAAAWLAGPKEWQTKYFASNLGMVLQFSGPDTARKFGEAIPDAVLREYYLGKLKGQ